MDQAVLKKVLMRVFSHKHYHSDSAEQLLLKAHKLTESLLFFELCHREHSYQY